MYSGFRQRHRGQPDAGGHGTDHEAGQNLTHRSSGKLLAQAPQSPKDRALRYSEFGTEVAASIRDAIYKLKPADSEELLVYAERLELCNSHANQWYAYDMHNRHGEAFDGCGRFWACNHKHCPGCLKKHVNRCRKLTTDAIARQKLFVGEHWTFLTLTIPNDGGSILERRQLINAAWAIFRKSKWWRSRVIGAAKNEELAITKRGHHYHMHLIARTKYIDYKLFRQAWTAAVVQAFAESSRELTIRTSDGLCQANAQKIGSLREAVNEVCKYFTKSGSWGKMDAGQLLESCRINRWPRMFELIGSFKPDSPNEDAATAADGMNNTILDERRISDAEYEQAWRRRVREVGAVDYLVELIDHFQDQVQIRQAQLRHKYTAARRFTLRGPPGSEPASIIRRMETIQPSRLYGPMPCDGWRYTPEGDIELIHSRA